MELAKIFLLNEFFSFVLEMVMPEINQISHKYAVPKVKRMAIIILPCFSDKHFPNHRRLKGLSVSVRGCLDGSATYLSQTLPIRCLLWEKTNS